MKDYKNLLNYQNYHFIGINGVSMSSIAKYLLDNGKSVSGSDNEYNDSSKKLQSMGVKYYLGHHKVAVNNKDVVIYTSAINEDNVELNRAKYLKIKCVSRAEILGNILSGYSNSICVAGTHGKTTTTTMILEVFSLANLNPAGFIGGESKRFSNYKKGNLDYVISEACEYKKNFLLMPHNCSVVLNIDNDHQDSYLGTKDLIETFDKFIDNSIAIVNADDKNCQKLNNGLKVTFGIKNQAEFTARNLRKAKDGYCFTAYHFNKRLGRIKLNILGRYNVYNALACIALSMTYKIDFETIKTALLNFENVARRNEYIGLLDDIKCYADYAHHPSELKAIFSAYNAKNKKTLIVFQPHTYSRTKYLMKEFIDTLKDQDVIIYKTYSARENYDLNGDGKTLADNLDKICGNVKYYDNFSALIECVRQVKNRYERVLFVGAGDIYKNILKFTKKN